jgi:hypothetical protein
LKADTIFSFMVFSAGIICYFLQQVIHLTLNILFSNAIRVLDG